MNHSPWMLTASGKTYYLGGVGMAVTLVALALLAPCCGAQKIQPAPASAVTCAAAPSEWLQQCSSHPATSRYTDKLVRAVGAHR